MMRNKKQLNIEIGMRIQKSREAAGLTQEQLAEAIERTTQFVSTIERGVAGPSIETILSLCEVLNVSSDWLLRGMRQSPDAISITEKLSALNVAQLSSVDRIMDEILRVMTPDK